MLISFYVTIFLMYGLLSGNISDYSKFRYSSLIHQLV
jgi:hypothetical protein